MIDAIRQGDPLRRIGRRSRSIGGFPTPQTSFKTGCAVLGNNGRREPPPNIPDPVSCQGLPDLVIAGEVPAMQIPSPDIPSWVLGASAFLLTLWASYRIGLWLIANVVRDIREQIEGE